MWFALAYSDYIDGNSNDRNTWVPSNVRISLGAFQSKEENFLVLEFYENMTNLQK